MRQRSTKAQQALLLPIGKISACGHTIRAEATGTANNFREYKKYGRFV